MKRAVDPSFASLCYCKGPSCSAWLGYHLCPHPHERLGTVCVELRKIGLVIHDNIRIAR